MLVGEYFFKVLINKYYMRGENNKGIGLLTKVTAIRWFGWGFGDPFLPILFLLMSESFFGTGFLTSIYYVIFFFSIPFAGFLADRIKIKHMILVGLIIYVFIGTGYFLAGLTGMIFFLILGRGLNGISYSLDQIGRETYFIRHTPKKNESQVFGHFDKVTSFWSITATLMGIVLINYLEIHWLLFMIVPTSIISIFFILKLKEKPIRKKKKPFVNPYSKMLKEIKGFNKNLKTLSLITFFFGMMRTIVYFFAPAVTYAQGGSLVSSAILILAYSIPSLFGEKLGKFADKIKYKGYFLTLSSLILVLLVLAFSPNYYLLLISMFIAGMTFEFNSLTNKGFMARNSDYERIGEIDGALNGIGSLGSIIGPIVFGLLLDTLHPMNSYLLTIGLVVFMILLIYKKRE